MDEKIIKIVKEILEEPINLETTRDTANNWDSINHIKIILMLQEEFLISFSAHEISNLNSIKDIINNITEKVSNN